MKTPVAAMLVLFTALAIGAPAHAQREYPWRAGDPGRPQPRFTAGHVMFGASVQATVFLPSEYNRVLALWGFQAFHYAVAFVPEVTVSVHANLMLGLRTGVAFAPGGAANADGAAMNALILDASAIGRWVSVVRAGRHWVVIPLLQVEGGVARASIDLRNETRASALPRLAAFIGVSFVARTAGLSLRFGYQAMPWRDAGGPGVDLHLSGLSFSLTLEQLR